VKLFFDENVSAKLSRLLASEYPGSKHVEDVGLLGAADGKIWDYARSEGFMIVSKDTDFRERSFVEGFPPKVIWLDCRKRRNRDDRRVDAARQASD